MKRFFLGIFCAIFACCDIPVRGMESDMSTGELLKLLDKELEAREGYVAVRHHRVDSLRSLINHTEDNREKLSLYFEMGLACNGLSADSAIVYYTRGFNLGREIGDSVLTQRFIILRARELRKLGAVHDGLEALEHVRQVGVYPENLSYFYDAGRKINFTMSAFYPFAAVNGRYLEDGLEFARKEIETREPGTLPYLLCQSLIYLGEGKTALHVAMLNDILDKADIHDYEYPLAVTMLGEYYAEHGKHEDAIRYFALGALANIYRTNRHGTALLRLGNILYLEHDIVRAHNYLSIALENALKSNAKMNAMMISEALMPVSKDMESHNQRRFMFMTLLVVCLGVAILLLVRSYLSNRREMKMMVRVKQSLATANLAKETYIAQFMNLCSSYMESLEDFNRVCRRKITAGQIDDLLQFIKAGKVIDEQRTKFYDIFDDSFLNVYPTFIEDVNKLLMPDKQVSLPAPNVLTTELRILAFTRLGVEDTAQVARFLGLSLNTIYTYCNKLRNKALNRETFEADVMKIGTIDVEG